MGKKPIPKIGLKADANYFDWHTDLGYNVMEIGSRDHDFKFKIPTILKTKDFLKGKEISMHTQTSRIFSCKEQGLPEFNEAELRILEAEIILCKVLEIKELIFHLKVGKLDEGETKILKKLLKFAKKNNVELIFESNSEVIAENTLDVLSKFPKLGYNLDLGHINVGINSGKFGMSLEEFLSRVKNRIIYIHAHNNNGLKDEHKSLDQGTLDWKHVLDQLNFKKIRKIIMEVRTKEEADTTKRLLEDYFKTRN
jgi:sugar phosphate isomerase/epimerase